MKDEKEETMEDGRKEGKRKKEKEDMLETRENEQKNIRIL